MSKARLKKEAEQCKALCLGHKPDPSFAYIRPIDEKLSKFEVSWVIANYGIAIISIYQ